MAELKLASAWRQRIKLRAEGNKLWAEAIIETYGNITLSWSWRTDDGECRLENGDVYSTETVAEKLRSWRNKEETAFKRLDSKRPD